MCENMETLNEAFVFLAKPLHWREPRNRDTSDDNGNHAAEDGFPAGGSATHGHKPFNDSFNEEADLIQNPFMVCALDAIRFHIVYEPECDESKLINTIFAPTMAHQVFGSGEVITGYKNLKISFKILPNSFHTCMEYTYSDIADDPLRCKYVDNIEESLKEWFPHLVKPEEFTRLQKSEEYLLMYGDIVLKFPLLDKTSMATNVYITKCNPTDKFMEYHKRFQALIVFFIDAASIIDYTDPNWVYYYLYKDVHKAGKLVARLPIGFCTVYKFTLSRRARVSQFFILPNYQQRGLGLRMLGLIYREFQEQDDFKYITVESPCEEFSMLRDKLDLGFIVREPQFAKALVLGGYTPAMGLLAQKRWKFSSEQVKHLVAVLRCYYTQREPVQHEIFFRDLKRDIYQSYKRKLTRIFSKSAKEERIARLKRIVDDDYLLNRTIHRDVVNYVKRMRPHMKYIESLLM